MLQFSGCEKRIRKKISLFRLSSKSIFNRWVFIILFIFLAFTGNATIYYVSNSGDDSNPGTSGELPWKTLRKINYFFRLEPGDQVLFKRGDEWAGSITVRGSGTSGSPIIYGAYGTGDKPKIYGSEKITGWTRHSGNIYKAKVNNEVVQLFINGKRASLARYPKSGYFDITKVNNPTQFESAGLNSGIDYTNAMWIGRTNPYTLNGGKIAKSDGQTITLLSAPSGSLGVKEGFFLANKLEFLTQAGEWYFDESNNTVYAWMPGSDSPDNYTIRSSTEDYNVYLEGKNYVTIKDLELLEAKEHGVYINQSDYVTITNNRIINPANSGINSYYWSNHSKVNGNYIYGANSYGISLYNNPGAVIQDNVIDEIGQLKNITRLPVSVWGYGIRADIGDMSIMYNRITNCGYIGISFYNGAYNIKHNYINGACQVLDDGGGIYTYNGHNYSNPGAAGSEVVGNIILNVHGNTEGKTADFYQASGIYLDNATHDILVKDNLIAGATLGVFLHEGGKNTVDGNTLMDCMLHLLIDREYESSTIINNLVYTTDRRDHSNWWGVNTHQRIIFQNNTSAICNFNTYVVPYIEKDVFANKTDFTHWQTETGQDVNSTYDGTDMKADESEQILYNDTKQTKTFNLGSAVFRDIYGKEISGTLKLEPFTSIILIGKDFSTINQNPHILDQSFYINSPVFDNDTIGKLAANDPDSEQILNYSIIHGDETGWFSIDSTSGVIYFTENFQTSFDLTFEFLVKVSDNAVNSLSDTAFVTVFIEGKDITPPVITSFNIPPLALDLTSPVHSFTATDDIGVTGYLLTESSLVPNINDEWKNEPSEEYTFSGEGTYTIYAWVKDSAGNISNSIADTITVLVPDLSPTFSEYLFEEDSGNTIIDTQGSNDGILFNDVMRVSEGVGSGLKFAGSGYINLGHCFGENVQNEVSMSAWIKPDTSGLGYQGVIMHGGPNTVTFGLFLNPVTKAIDFITNGTTTPTLPIENAEKLWDGNWHHLVAIYNGEEKIIYLDNDVIATIQATGTIDLGYGYNLLIGAGRDETISTLLYKGLLDEVRIYNYAIASAEVGELFHPVNRELNKISTIEDIIICEGEEYLGWTQPGKYKRVLQRFSPFASGADSIVITNLYVNPSYTIYEDVTIYYGENYKEWSESGTYQMTWSSYQGCDSIVVTNLIVEGKKTQYIELEKGWNIFSSYIIPNNMNMEVVMNELRLSNNLVMVQDESENTYEEWNSTDSWINNIGDVKKTDGYKILVNSSSVLEISGREIELPLEIDLKKGVNIITFPFESQIDAIQIFQPLIDQGILEKVQDESGNSLEYWNSIGWLNGIGNLNAGKGYIVHVSNNGTLKIDSISEKSNQTFTANSEPVYFNVDYGGNGFAHMNVNITGLKESGLDVGDEIAIYDGMYCVGAIQLNELNFKMNAVSIPASGSDKIRRIGFYDGNPVDFRIWRKQKNELVNFIPEVVKGELKFNKYSSLFVTFNQVVNLSENIEVYPNPASNFVIIEIPILPQEGVRVFLLDATGQELMSRVIYSNFEKLNVENLSSGLYFLKTYVKDKIFTHKLLIA